MTYVDDLYEPGDDREPELDERDEQPVDLAEVEDAYQVVFPKVAWLGSSGERLVDAVPLLIAELREARRRLAEFEALPTREEWAVTDNDSTPPRAALGGYHLAPEVAMRVAAEHGVQVWRRVVTTKPVVVRPWEPISSEAPF
jgi:hypothetical protein